MQFYNKLFNLLGFGVLVVNAALAQISVTTHHYDNDRTGRDQAEQVLTASNVKSSSFGKLFSYPVDGYLYAQPLYVPGVTLSNGTTHNVLYVVTMNNSVYAFDADSNTGSNASPLWTKNYNNAAAGITPVPSSDVEVVSDIIGPVGIESTPVIDLPESAMYFVVRTKENGAYLQRLHAINITNGAELANSPVVITASVSSSKGTATFDPKKENQRSALALANGMVYVAWASHTDSQPYYGWVMAYSAYSSTQSGSSIQQSHVWCDTVGGNQGGIWQSGSGPVIDSNGNLYYGTGNGSWDGTTKFGSSTVKLSPSLQVLDYFTPDNYQTLNNNDQDVGTGGVLFLPGTDRLVQTSKQGLLYLLSTTNMGHLLLGNNQIPQVLSAAVGHIHSGPTYWDSPTRGPLVYIWSETDYLKAYHFNGTTFDTSPAMKSTFQDPPGMPGGFLAVSSNGSTPGTGVLWVNVPYSGDANHATVPGVLRAFNADDLTTELWDSHMNLSRDDFGSFAKFVPPVVANGKVYMATFSNKVAVYGLLQTSTGISETLSSNTLSVNTQSSGSVGVNVTSTGTLPGPVSLAATGVPGGVSAQFTPTTINGSGSVTLLLTTTSSAVAGSYVITVSATSGAYSASQKLTLTISGGTTTVIQINSGGGAVGTWIADADFSGGLASSVNTAIDTTKVSNPAPQQVYQSRRFQNATYTIPNLNAGQQYLVRLHFAEIYVTTTGKRQFNVAINGTAVLNNFDIVAAAGGPNIANIQQFTAVANSSGQIVIAATQGSVNNPQINGIEIQTTKTTPAGIRINAGGGASGTFAADTDFSGGSVSSTAKAINMAQVTNPAPQQVYQSIRFQNSTYTIPNLNVGQQYLVRLHFAETYFTATGMRKFNVAINGTSVLQNFDIVAAAGAPLTALVKEFTVTPNASGQIVIAFTNGSANNALINGIEIQ